MYSIYLRMHGRLLWYWRDGNASATHDVTTTPVSPIFPSLGFLPTTLHASQAYLSSGWPVAHLIATAILGIGALIGAFTYISQPGEMAQSPIEREHVAQSAAINMSVAQVTGIVDCKSADSKLPALGRVAIGEKFELAGGMVEITYDAGAKVILQGPVHYVVDSRNSGLLSVGKLTGTVEGKATKGFSVQTPTAIVTDLGTEFGVAVDEKGATTSYVFRGTVALHAIGHAKDARVADTVLQENESARTERVDSNTDRVVVRRTAIEPRVFVRRLEQPTPSPLDVLAWFRMGEDEPNARDGLPAGKEIHSHNKKPVRLERHGTPTYSADTEAPSSAFSMTFHGGNDGECFHSHRFPFVPNDYFILEAWAKVQKVGSKPQVIVASGQGAKSGYCLAVVDGRWLGVLEAVGWIDSGVACEIGKWTHLALVCERGKTQLWVNGTSVGKAIETLPIMPDGRFTIGGSPESPRRVFNGEIDEVRLSTFIAPFRPEMLLLRKADRSQRKTERTKNALVTQMILFNLMQSSVTGAR
jgi:hypothetical protein